MTFQTNPVELEKLLNDAHTGALQLPEFQRSYVWSDDDVKSLIASVALGFPIGALLTLQTGGEVNFKPRLLAGVKKEHEASGSHSPDRDPDELLLDGQQRITSLYGALFGQTPMKVRKPKSDRKTIERLYYLDLRQSLDQTRSLEEAIIGVPAEKILHIPHRDQIDISKREAEFENALFPLNLTFKDEAFDWIEEYRDYWREKDEKHIRIGKAFRDNVLKTLRKYQIPLIRLSNETSREAVCLIFEKVNVGGKQLDAFELVTAIFAGAENPINLREDWKQRRKRIKYGRDGQGIENPVFRKLRGFEFLQAVSLVITHAQGQTSARRDALLGMKLEDYRKHADTVEEGFRQAGKFLNEQKILWEKDLPYPAQLVALAAIFAISGQAAHNAEAKKKLSIWFWRTSLGEDFGAGVETKLAKDAEEVSRWLEGGDEPERLRLLTFNPERLWSLRNRNSAAYKAFSALLMHAGCKDFITGQEANITNFSNDPMDIHHIFPERWCRNNKKDKDKYNSIINKTPITASSNRMIGGRAPSEYLAKIEKDHGLSSEQLDDILRSHIIDPQFLRNDDFEGFLQDRARRLTELAAKAMGMKAEELQPDQPSEPESTLPPEAIDEEEETG